MFRAARGYSLMEILVSIAIVAALSGIFIPAYLNSRKGVLLKTTGQNIVDALYAAQQRAIAQEDSSVWGVHFENPPGGQDFFALFRGAAYVSAIETRILPSELQLTDPPDGLSRDIVFAKLTGANASGSAQSAALGVAGGSASVTITVSPSGVITKTGP